MASLSLASVDDVIGGLKNTNGWLALTRRNLASLNRRSSIGIVWQMLSTTIFILALSFVYSAVFSISLTEYIPYIAVGYVTWLFISNTLASAPMIFITNKQYIDQRNLPLTTYVIADVLAKYCVFMLQFAVSIVFCFLLSVKPTLALFFLPISAVIFLCTSFAVSIILGILTVKYRDVAQVVNSVILIIFLSTPILWKPGLLSGRAFIADANPFFHFINIVRTPVLEGYVPLLSVAVTVSVALVLNVVALFLLSRYKDRIVFWL